MHSTQAVFGDVDASANQPSVAESGGYAAEFEMWMLVVLSPASLMLRARSFRCKRILQLLLLSSEQQAADNHLLPFEMFKTKKAFHHFEQCLSDLFQIFRIGFKSFGFVSNLSDFFQQHKYF